MQTNANSASWATGRPRHSLSPQGPVAVGPPPRAERNNAVVGSAPTGMSKKLPSHKLWRRVSVVHCYQLLFRGHKITTLVIIILTDDVTRKRSAASYRKRAKANIPVRFLLSLNSQTGIEVARRRNILLVMHFIHSGGCHKVDKRGFIN